MQSVDIDVKIMCLLHVVRELRDINKNANCEQLRKETDTMTRDIVKQIDGFRKML